MVSQSWRFSYLGPLIPYTRTLTGQTTRRAVAYHGQQAALGYAFKLAWKPRPLIPAGVPISVRLRFRVKSLGVGDLDNQIKAVWDAANQVVWTDDRAVVWCLARKQVGEPGFDFVVHWGEDMIA